jgi:hypothetical protein
VALDAKLHAVLDPVFTTHDFRLESGQVLPELRIAELETDPHWHGGVLRSRRLGRDDDADSHQYAGPVRYPRASGTGLSRYCSAWGRFDVPKTTVRSGPCVFYLYYYNNQKMNRHGWTAS